MVGRVDLTVRIAARCPASARLDGGLLLLLAEQTSQAVAILGRDMVPVFLNPAMRTLLGLDEGGLSAPHVASISAQLRSTHGDAPVVEILRRHREWTGEISLSRCDRSGWSLTLDSRIVAIRDGPSTVAYAVIARPPCTHVPARIAGALTRREAEVLGGLMSGGTSKVIAHRLGISHRTVEAHRGNIMRKLEARSLPDLFQRVVSVDRA